MEFVINMHHLTDKITNSELKFAKWTDAPLFDRFGENLNVKLIGNEKNEKTKQNKTENWTVFAQTIWMRKKIQYPLDSIKTYRNQEPSKQNFTRKISTNGYSTTMHFHFWPLKCMNGVFFAWQFLLKKKQKPPKRTFRVIDGLQLNKIHWVQVTRPFIFTRDLCFRQQIRAVTIQNTTTTTMSQQWYKIL